MAHDVLVNIFNSNSDNRSVTSSRFTEEEKREIISIVFAAICERLQVEE